MSEMVRKLGEGDVLEDGVGEGSHGQRRKYGERQSWPKWPPISGNKFTFYSMTKTVTHDKVKISNSAISM
jgi:hypothetical protein